MLNLFVVIFLLLTSLTANSKNTTLKVGVISQNPPYAIQGSNHHFFGFDMAVIDNSCMKIKRECRYQKVDFQEAVSAIKNGDINVAIGIISMSDAAPENMKFTIPYLLVNARIIGRNKPTELGYNFNFLNKKKVGILSSNVSTSDLVLAGIQYSKIVGFKNQHDLIASLSKGKIDFAVLNEYSAKYWQRNSTGFLKIIGQPLKHSCKVRMMVNANDQALLEEINNSIIHYQNEGQFVQDYHKYISSFFEEFKG